MKPWWLLFLLPTVALAKTESYPEMYNRGVTAYHSNDFARASTLFQDAISSPDRALQQRALYNFGNACYRLGEAQPPQAQQLWQRAIKSYEDTLALNPNDADAKFNHDLVKKKLEELKKQQQQQQQKQDQQKEKNEQQQKQNQQQHQQNEQQREQQNKQEQEKQQAQQQEQQKQKDRQQQQQPEQAQVDKLDKQQAKALLDDLRQNEQNWNFFPEVQMKDLKDSGEPAKDW
jgi:Ca-activated chloride channel family protein